MACRELIRLTGKVEEEGVVERGEEEGEIEIDTQRPRWKKMCKDKLQNVLKCV